MGARVTRRIPHGALSPAYGDLRYGHRSRRVEWRIVRPPLISLGALFYSAKERASGAGVFRGDQFDYSPLVSVTSLPLHNLRDYDGLPALQTQINLFSDGGCSIGILTAHVLADAQSLTVFAHQWAVIARKTFNPDNQDSPLPGIPIFDPVRLDAHAA